MKIISCTQTPSPVRADHIRLTAKVESETPGLDSEDYWFEVPERYQDSLSVTGNPWLLCLAPVAMLLGERLQLNRPVDSLLLKNVHQLMKVWSFWFPKLKPIPIEADTYPVTDSVKGTKTLSFFSGGVDAFFTAIYHDETADPYDQIPIDDLVHVWGFDIPVSNHEAYAKMMPSLQNAALQLSKEFVPVITNMRDTQLRKCEWEFMYHGTALASVAYLLERRYRLALISSSSGYHATFPQGSHPAVMPLMSSEGLRIEQSGATFNRVDKIEWISRSEAVKSALHVCFHLGNEKNCGRCLKCFRTMLTLDLLGVLDEFKTFELTSFDPKNAAKMYLWQEDDVWHAHQIRRLALKRNRREVALAMNASIRGTKTVKKILAGLSGIKQLPGGRKIYDRAENALLKGKVGGDERYYPAAKDSPFVQHSHI